MFPPELKDRNPVHPFFFHKSLKLKFVYLSGKVLHASRPSSDHITLKMFVYFCKKFQTQPAVDKDKLSTINEKNENRKSLHTK